MPAIGNALGLPFARFRSSALAPPVAGPDIWLDANQELFANNDPVGQFTDWSGNGNHFTSSGTARPTFKTNRINGRPSVLADGVDDGLILSSFASKSAWTVMFVGCLNSFAATSNILSIDDYAPDGTYILLQQNSSTSAAINANVGVTGSITSSVGVANAILIMGNSSSGTIRASDNSMGTTAANYLKALSNMRLFRRGDGLYANYEISELFFYPSVLSSADRNTIWTYFNTRYGTAIPATP